LKLRRLVLPAIFATGLVMAEGHDSLVTKHKKWRADDSGAPPDKPAQ